MDEYEELRFIARGSQGEVTLHRRITDGQLVVHKRVPVDIVTTNDRTITSKEVKVLSKLHHPHVIKYYDSFFEGSTIIIVMEYALGGTLWNYLRSRSSVPLPEKEAIGLFSQIVLGIHYIHSQNILHRDLKTQNIFLSGDKQIVKIGDFGISKVLSSHSNAQSLVGTPNYLSPEMCEGKPYNDKNDIWALGCILYELLSLKMAFDAPSLSAVIVKITQGNVKITGPRKPSELTANLLHCLLRKDPNLRPSAEMLMAHPALTSAIPSLVTLGANPSPSGL